LKLNNLTKRILVGIFGVPVILLSIWYGRFAFVALVGVIVVFAQYEFYRLAEKKQIQPLKIIGLIGGLLIVLNFYFFKNELTLFILSIMVILLLITELFRNKPNALLNQMATLGGLIYPATLFSFLILIRESSPAINRSYQYGAKWVFAILISTWICDTAAYFFGKKFGRHKLFPRVSPNKTVEGAISGLVFALLIMGLVKLTFFKTELLRDLLIVGAICGTVGQVGDLVESLFKRDVQLKDSSKLLPGHGGFLDRFDSLFFNAPVAYFYIKYLIIH